MILWYVVDPGWFERKGEGKIPRNQHIKHTHQILRPDILHSLNDLSVRLTKKNLKDWTIGLFDTSDERILWTHKNKYWPESAVVSTT